MAPEWPSSKGGQGPGIAISREWRCPGLYPLRKNLHLMKTPITRRYQESEKHTGRASQKKNRDRGNHNRRTPQGMTGNLDQAEGGKGGANRHCKRRQMQAHIVGSRYERRRLACVECERCLGGRIFELGEEGGSR